MFKDIAWRTSCLAFAAASICTLAVHVQGQPTEPARVTADASNATRFGLFNWLDRRSKYNSNFFPEPFLADEMDGDQEMRASWVHTERRNHRVDEVSSEVEKGFDQLTIEIEAHYSRDVATEDGATDRVEGFGPIEIAARHPIYEFVSPDGRFDYTFGVRVEFAIATGSHASKNTELVGGVFQTIAIGERFSIQTTLGYSTLFGPGEEGGEQVLEYAAVFGYNLDLTGKPIDLVRITPIVEIDGETGLNHGQGGSTSLSGVAGFEFAFDSIGIGQPKFLIGYVFPLNDNARDDEHWGFVTSILLEY